jgi:hypothetical protein
MTNANPARGQKPRRRTAREMHAEHPKFQTGQVVVRVWAAPENVRRETVVNYPEPGYCEVRDADGNTTLMPETEFRLARPTPGEAKRHYLAKYVSEVCLLPSIMDGEAYGPELKDAARRVRLLAHYLEYALACERWIAEGRPEVPRHGEDGCPVPPGRE